MLAEKHLLPYTLGIGMILLSSCMLLPTEFKTVNIGNRYSIQLPEYLELNTTLNEDAELQYANLSQQIFLLGRHNQRSQLSESELDDLSALFSFHVENLVLELQNPTVPTADTLRVNGLPGVKGQFTGLFKGEETTYQITILQGQEYMYQFIAWAPANKMADFLPDIDAVVNSFKLLGTETP